MEIEYVIELKCNDCDWSSEVQDVPGAEHAAWDHIGKYSEKPNDHTVMARNVIRFKFR